ncbi:MAG: hypothetical protein ACYDDF_05360 [Thermoplasmatota archaeon]
MGDEAAPPTKSGTANKANAQNVAVAHPPTLQNLHEVSDVRPANKAKAKAGEVLDKSFLGAHSEEDPHGPHAYTVHGPVNEGGEREIHLPDKTSLGFVPPTVTPSFRGKDEAGHPTVGGPFDVRHNPPGPSSPPAEGGKTDGPPGSPPGGVTFSAPSDERPATIQNGVVTFDGGQGTTLPKQTFH